MSLKGGTVSFTDEINKQEVIFEILNDDSTTIKEIAENLTGYGTVVIFHITLSGEKFRKYFKNNPPNALLIKVFKRCKINEVENEINIHQKINSETNMMPIAPSILLDYTIKDDSTFKDLNSLCGSQLSEPEMESQGSFCRLIKFVDEEPEDDADYDKDDEDDEDDLVNKILVMEFIECDTYKEFYLKFSQEFKESTYNFKILETTIKLSLIEVQIFFTYYLASVLADKDYHHGDLHPGNVMICQNKNSTPLEINPFLIDFGRAGTFDTLRFVELEQKYLETLESTIDGQDTIISGKESIEGSYLILHKIYSMALQNKDAIAEYVRSLLKKKNYVDAVLTLNMCVNANLSEIKDSQFTCYMKNILGVPDKYEYVDDEPSVWEYLFNINNIMSTKFNREIGNLIQTRKQLEEGKLNPVGGDGGKLVLRRQKNSKTRRYRRSKLHKNKSNKNKSNKNKSNKTKKTKKSKKSKN
jgi:tRNA A-37 threonylcarbamoyl transferase component Bud32